MRKIYFQQDKEFVYCCEVLFQREKLINIGRENGSHWNNIIIIEDVVDKNDWIHCIVMVYLSFRLQKKIKDIAQSIYFYDDETSLNDICNMTLTILRDRFFVANLFPNNNSLYAALFSLFNYHLSHVKHIYFDAFMLFSMKSFDPTLIKAVGYGIDEIKQDEAHEQFIAKAHRFVSNRPIQVNKVYLLVQDECILFQDDGMVYSKQQLVQAIKKTPLYFLQLEEDEPLLTPIIALAPQEIHVFAEQPMEGKVNSLCRIFKEKVKLYTPSQFPFMSKVN